MVHQLYGLCDMSQPLGGPILTSGNEEDHSYLMVTLQSLNVYHPRAHQRPSMKSCSQEQDSAEGQIRS